MNQSTISEHVNKGQAIELCPQCFEPITPYWQTVKIDPIPLSPNVIMTHERSCKCGYKEQDKTTNLKSLVCSTNECSKCTGCD